MKVKVQIIGPVEEYVVEVPQGAVVEQVVEAVGEMTGYGTPPYVVAMGTAPSRPLNKGAKVVENEVVQFIN